MDGDFNPKPVWSYTQGLIAQAMLQVWKATGEEKYHSYARSYADKMIDASGTISGYNLKEYNLDRLNSGKFLFDLYEITKDERYKKAIFTLREQLKTHPRTSEGGFLAQEGLPLTDVARRSLHGSSLLCPIRRGIPESEAFDDIINQFKLIHKHNFDPKSGLYFHGWDESKVQKWANPVTGCSPHVWGRAMGWYAMAWWTS